MTTILELLYCLLKAVGLWEGLLNAHETKVKAQALADSPITEQELLQTLHDGKL